MFSTTLKPVPTNNVTGSGTARIHLEGNKATVTVDVKGLPGGVPRATERHWRGGRRSPRHQDSPYMRNMSISGQTFALVASNAG